MRERFYRFMQGRYGNDQFGRFLLVVTLIFMVISIVGPDIFYLLAMGLLIYSYFRMFSKNIYARRAENEWYLRKQAKVRGFFASQQKDFVQRKTHHIYRCPNCRQKIRIPRGHGRVEIRCPKCSTRFIKKS